MKFTVNKTTISGTSILKHIAERHYIDLKVLKHYKISKVIKLIPYVKPEELVKTGKIIFTVVAKREVRIEKLKLKNRFRIYKILISYFVCCISNNCYSFFVTNSMSFCK